MLSYRDMTFCINTTCTRKCYRRLTDEIRKQAKDFGLPIAYANFDCEKQKDDEDKE
jgi:hypothetical protein